MMKTYSCVLSRLGHAAVTAVVVLAGWTGRASLIAFNMQGITANGGAAYAPGVGLEFTVGVAPLQVDSLGGALWVGDWNSGASSSANLDAQDIRVKLWRRGDQALLADVRLTSSEFASNLTPTPANYTFRYFREAVPGLVLDAGATYVIALYGTTNTGGQLQYINNLHNAASPVAVASDLTFSNGNFYTSGATPGGIPSVADSIGNPKFGGPTFEYTSVPEPSTVVLLMAGLPCLIRRHPKGEPA